MINKIFKFIVISVIAVIVGFILWPIVAIGFAYCNVFENSFLKENDSRFKLDSYER